MGVKKLIYKHAVQLKNRRERAICPGNLRQACRKVRTGILENPARTLELPLLVRSVAFFFLFVSTEG